MTLDERSEATLLLEAVLNEDTAAVEALLLGGAEPNPANVEFNHLPLVNAATQDSTLEIVRLLVGAKANIDVVNEETGSTPLVLAIAHKADGVARFLIEQGANVNVAGDVRDVFGRQSPLILAAEDNNIEMARLLLEHGADPNRFGDFHGRPLHYAAFDARSVLLELLLDHGADLWFRDDDCNHTAFELAVMRNQWQAAQALFLRADQQRPNCLGTRLHALAATGDEQGVESLLDSGVSVDLRDGGGKTALHWVVGGPREAASIILKVLGHERTATRQVPARMAELLLRRGANIDAVDAAADTPLHDACAWGGKRQLALASQLVDAGAKVGLKDETGWTPLLLAARAGAPPALLEALFKRGADPSDTQMGVWNALTYAAHRGHVESVRALIQHGVSVNSAGKSPLHAAVAAGHLEVVRVLLDAHADPNASDAEGKLPADLTKSPVILALLATPTKVSQK